MDEYVQLDSEARRQILTATLRDHEARHYGITLDRDLAEARGDEENVAKFDAMLAELDPVIAFFRERLAAETPETES
jgi:hypothetical protein